MGEWQASGRVLGAGREGDLAALISGKCTQMHPLHTGEIILPSLPLSRLASFTTALIWITCPPPFLCAGVSALSPLLPAPQPCWFISSRALINSQGMTQGTHTRLKQRKRFETVAAQVRAFKTLDPSTTASGFREDNGKLAVGRTGRLASAPKPLKASPGSASYCLTLMAVRWPCGQ